MAVRRGMSMLVYLVGDAPADVKPENVLVEYVSFQEAFWAAWAMAADRARQLTGKGKHRYYVTVARPIGFRVANLDDMTSDGRLGRL